MKTTIIIIFFITLPVLLLGADTLSLSKAIETGLAKNFQIRLARKSTEIADNNVHPGNAGMLPQINANAAWTYSENQIDMLISTGQQIMPITSDGSVSRSYNGSIALDWTLFDGMAMFINYSKFEELKKRSQIELQIAIEEFLRDITLTYYNALRIQENINVINENLKLSRQRYNKAKSSIEYGSSESIALQALVDLNRDSTELLKTNLQYKSITKNLNYLMGVNQKIDYVILEKKGEISEIGGFSELREKTLNQNNSINKAILEGKITDLDKELIMSSYYPIISFSTGYSYSMQESESGFMLENEQKGFNASFNVRWNIFNGFKNKISADNAEIRSIINDISVSQIKARILTNLDNKYDELQELKIIFALQKRNISIAEENFNRIQTSYDYGNANSIELRTAQINLLQNKYSLNDVKFQIKSAQTEIKLLTGELLSK